jgi:hypothetical protein
LRASRKEGSFVNILTKFARPMNIGGEMIAYSVKLKKNDAIMGPSRSITKPMSHGKINI